MSFVKTLVLRDDVCDLSDLGKRYQIAQEVGKKTFKGNGFKIRDILGKFDFGYIAVYEFERSTVPVSEGNKKTGKK